MKRILLATFVLFLCVVMVACGTQTTNANVSAKINRTLDNMENTLKEVQSISEEDILITEISPQSTYTAITNPRRGVDSTRQIVDYPVNNSFGYSETNAMRNVNTYNPYGRAHNVNSYSGYGETNQIAYNEINQAQYEQNGVYGGMYGNGGMYGLGYGYNGYNGNGIANPYARGISNVNTYWINRNNVNTYNPSLINNQTNNENITDNTQNQTLTNTEEKQSNINSYKTESNSDLEYNQYEKSSNLSNQFSKLSSLYSVAGNVVNVNKAIAEEKNYIFTQVQTIKELAKSLSSNEIQLNDSQISSISSLLENIHSNLNRITLTKNEIRYEVDKVKSLKNNYNDKTEQLSSRYVRLTNCLETRYTYYCNISSCLDQLTNYLQSYVNGEDIIINEEVEENTNNQVIENTTEQNINNQTTENTTEQNINNQTTKTDQNNENNDSQNNQNVQESETSNEIVNENTTNQIVEDNQNQIVEDNAVNPTANQTNSKNENIELQNEKLRKIFAKQWRDKIDNKNKTSETNDQVIANQEATKNETTNEDIISEETEKPKLPLIFYDKEQTDNKEIFERPYRPPFIKYPKPKNDEIKENDTQTTSNFPFKDPKKNDFLSFYFPPNRDDLKPLNAEEIANM